MKQVEESNLAGMTNPDSPRKMAPKGGGVMLVISQGKWN